MALITGRTRTVLRRASHRRVVVYAGDTRGPLTVPIWYQYTPGGEPWILTGPGVAQGPADRGHGFFSLMVERLEPTTRYVAVDGAVSSIEPGTDAQLEEMTRRYLSGEAAERYLEFARNELGEHVVDLDEAGALAVGRHGSVLDQREGPRNAVVSRSFS